MPPDAVPFDGSAVADAGAQIANLTVTLPFGDFLLIFALVALARGIALVGAVVKNGD